MQLCCGDGCCDSDRFECLDDKCHCTKEKTCGKTSCCPGGMMCCAGSDDGNCFPAGYGYECCPESPGGGACDTSSGHHCCGDSCCLKGETC